MGHIIADMLVKNMEITANCSDTPGIHILDEPVRNNIHHPDSYIYYRLIILSYKLVESFSYLFTINIIPSPHPYP
jgi:hypothetical protein